MWAIHAHPLKLLEFVSGNKSCAMDVGILQDPALWACLAGMATDARDLNTAEVAYAAVNEVCMCAVSTN